MQIIGEEWEQEKDNLTLNISISLTSETKETNEIIVSIKQEKSSRPNIFE